MTLKEVAPCTDPWVCPWGICNHEQAQECRADTSLAKRHGAAGCGGRFPPDTTPEQARQIVAPPRKVVADVSKTQRREE